jgi:hypothetical protein
MRFMAAVLLLTTAARAAVITAPGYLARTIPTPTAVQGGVVRLGGALLVGQGAFGAGGEYVVRIDGAGVTVVATGFNSLGGFDVEPDGTLLVVDNGGELPGAATGDTLYEIPAATRRMDAVAAAGHEVVPAGSIPAAQDVLAIPETILVTDAAGPGLGRVLRISEEGVVDEFATGLDFLGGIAFATGGTVFVANLDASFTGSLVTYDYYGLSRRVRAAGLSGAFAPVVDRDGQTVLLSGGTAADGSGTVVAVAPDGRISERARGFGFTTEMFFDTAREELLVLDAGVPGVTVICGDLDGDGVCDADDRCSTERPLVSAEVVLGKRFRASGETPVTGDPNPAVRGLGVLIEGARAIVDAAVPSGASWKKRRNGWRYADSRGTIAGITGIRLRTDAGRLLFVVRGRFERTPVAAGDSLRVSLGHDPAAVRRPCAVAVLACRAGRRIRCT